VEEQEEEEEEEEEGYSSGEEDDDDEEEMEMGDEEAASILTSVLPHDKAVVSSERYEDLLDCLASLASDRASLEPPLPLHRRVAQLSVDDIDVHKRSSDSSTPTPTPPAGDGDGDADVDVAPVARRPRAYSNPEGCDAWKAYELDLKPEKTGGATGGKGDGLSPSRPRAVAAAAVGPSLPHMLAKYATIYNKNGRIGIYTREERDVIIARFREKRSRRVWAKKIR
jgi:hypothetical protein